MADSLEMVNTPQIDNTLAVVSSKKYFMVKTILYPDIFWYAPILTLAETIPAELFYGKASPTVQTRIRQNRNNLHDS